MISIIRERLRQGMRTIGYPESVPTLPDRFLGLPVLDQSKCTDGCRACARLAPRMRSQPPTEICPSTWGCASSAATACGLPAGRRDPLQPGPPALEPQPRRPDRAQR